MSKMSAIVLYFLTSLTLFLLPFAKGAASFIHVPVNESVEVEGEVKFIWDYVVDNRNTEFSTISPIWDYYSYVFRNWTEIAREDVRKGWNWTVTLGTFPPTLKNRVTKEGNATLVIKNVKSTDAGIYRCTLKLTGDSSISREAHLSVTPATMSSTPTSTTTANITDTTTRTPTTAATNPTTKHEGLSGGEIAGIVVGGILGIIVGAIICCCFYKKCTKKRRPDNVPPDKKQENEMNSPSA